MTNDQTIGAFIQHFYEKNGKTSLFFEQRAVEIWEEAVGEFIAKQTVKISAAKGILYVTISNSALRFELLGNRTQIIAKINQELGCEAIKGIIIK